jgi:triosephosphate isomerase
MPQKLIAGNWKMNGLVSSLSEIEKLARALDRRFAEIDTVVCLPATLLALASARVSGSPLQLGGQTCHAEARGAHTGDISAEMLADVGASYVITGHSERRADHGETSEAVAAQSAAALRAGLVPIICVGETLAEREAGATGHVIRQQLAGSIPASADPSRLVVAYEPVWAIGTGKVASPGQIETVHALIREDLESRFAGETGDLRILYGGSMNVENAATILAVNGVDGGLIGGASLNADSLLAICKAALIAA